MEPQSRYNSRILRKSLIVSLLCLSLGLSAAAQDESALIPEVFQKENAVMTRSTERLDFDYRKGKLEATTSVQTEIRLLTDVAPALYNTISFSHGYFASLKDMEGYALVPEGKGFKKVRAREFKTVKATSSAIFFDDAHQTTITFTGLTKGASTVASYKLHHHDVHFLPAFYFQSYLPTLRSEYIVTVPPGVEIGWKLKGTDTSGIRFSYTAKGNSTVYTWTAEHVPRHKSYENAPDPSYYLPHILVYVKTYQQNRRDSIRQVFGAVGDLYRFYRKLIRNVDNTVAAELKPLVDSVTNGASSQEEKANRIYRYVQEHIKYVAFEDGLNGFIPRAAADVWKRRYGDCKDMTSLLVAMCRQAGIPAYFTWIGTRKNPYAYEDTPLPIVDNHMICTIQLQDRWFFLDGTDAQIPFGIPPAGIQGKEALVGIDEERYKILVVPVAAAENNLTLDSTFIRLSGRKVAGLARMKLQGYPAWSLRDVLNYKNEHEKEDLVMRVMSRGSNKFIQKRFDYTASDDLEKSFQATSEFELNDYSQHTGREWYLNMHLVRSFEDMLIDKAERLAPLEHRYLGKTRQVVVLEIPEGYQVEHLPPAAERSASGLWSFRVSYEVVDNKVLLTKEFEIKSLYIKPEQFELHNQLVKDLKDQYRQTVSLKAK